MWLSIEPTSIANFPYLAERPPVVKVQLTDVTCKETEPATFTAEFDKKVPVKSVKWFRDEQEISPSDKEYTITTDGNKCLLKIHKSATVHAGQYTVSVEGTKTTAKLTVICKYNLHVLSVL